jgi:hypothetical protein
MQVQVFGLSRLQPKGSVMHGLQERLLVVLCSSLLFATRLACKLATTTFATTSSTCTPGERLHFWLAAAGLKCCMLTV